MDDYMTENMSTNISNSPLIKFFPITGVFDAKGYERCRARPLCPARAIVLHLAKGGTDHD